MSGKFIKGALVEFMETFLIPLPNVIIFQYNPETLTHTWTPAESVAATQNGEVNPLAVKSLPGESFSLTIAVDANDAIADGNPVTAGIAAVSGVYSRLAAMEMLQFPTAPNDRLSLVGSATQAAGAPTEKQQVPLMQVPTVLFVWGPGRILPVRVTGLTITEKSYDAFLNPTHAEANLSLRVLTPEELKFVNGSLKDIAKGAYKYSLGLRQALAAANLANAVDSIIGMLPI